MSEKLNYCIIVSEIAYIITTVEFIQKIQSTSMDSLFHMENVSS